MCCLLFCSLLSEISFSLIFISEINDRTEKVCLSACRGFAFCAYFIKCIIVFCWGIIFIINLFEDFLIKVLTLEIHFGLGKSNLFPCMNPFKTSLPIEQYGSSF